MSRTRGAAKDHPARQAHPAAALLLLAGLLAFSVAADAWVVLALLLAAAAGLLLASGAGLRHRLLGGSLALAVPFALLAGLWGSQPLVGLGPLVWHRDGLEAGLRFGLRAAVAVASSVWLLHAVRPGDALRALQRWPALGVAVTGTLRFAPAAVEDWHRVREAQAMRGHRLGRGPGAAREMVPLLVPLFVATVRRGRALQEALDAAAFASGPRTRRAPLPWRGPDVALAGLGAALLALALWRAVPVGVGP